jgi:DNA-binding transcriptional LysR family regulator
VIDPVHRYIFLDTSMLDEGVNFKHHVSHESLQKRERPMQPYSRMLTYFVEVARLGSVRKASEHLNVSASAIDRQILSAEDGLGVPLFNRLPSGMRLTAAGELLLRGALDWRRDFARIKEQISDLSGLRRGFVRLAVIEAMVRGFLPNIVAGMRERYPGIALELHILPNDEIGEAVARGEFDIGLLLNPQSSKDIVVRAFREVPVGVVMRSGHELAGKSSLRFSSLSQEAVIRPAEPLEIAELFRVLETSSGLKVNAALSSNNIAMIKSLVAQGAGISVLSILDVAAEIAEGSLSFVPLIDATLRTPVLALCHSRHQQMSGAAALLIGTIEEQESWTP